MAGERMAANTVRGDGRWLARTALLLVLIGGGLIAIAAAMPWHTDSDAYFAGLNAIRGRLYETNGTLDFDAASDAFHSLQDQYRTLKWLYADLGYSALSWGVLALTVAFIRNDGEGRLTTRSGLLTSLATLAGLGLLLTGLLASGLQPMGREQIPEWADSFAIVLFGALALMAIIAPTVFALALWPVVFTQRQPAPLLAASGRGWMTSVIVTVVYLVPIAGAAVLLISVGQTAGWAASPAGALLLWSLLNARAIWLGQSANTPALP